MIPSGPRPSFSVYQDSPVPEPELVRSNIGIDNGQKKDNCAGGERHMNKHGKGAIEKQHVIKFMKSLQIIS